MYLDGVVLQIDACSGSTRVFRYVRYSSSDAPGIQTFDVRLESIRRCSEYKTGSRSPLTVCVKKSFLELDLISSYSRVLVALGGKTDQP